MSDKYVWRVVVINNGGDEPRDLVPADYDMEPETGARVKVQFWPPAKGSARHYLSRSGACARHDLWVANGVTSEITKSLPIAWPEPPTQTREAAS